MALGAWLNPAGGLRYHARALLGARRWAPYRLALGAWLARFEPTSERVVLVGPSAGHCVPDAFLRRFSQVIALEPDPVAGLLLARRLRDLGLREAQIERRDLLIRPLLDHQSGLAELLRAEPRASVVFCNVLGQTRFLMPDGEFSRFKAAFRQKIRPELESRAWLSFHDRFSGALAPSFNAPFTAPARLSDPQVLRDLYGDANGTDPIELLDHDSGEFFQSDLPHSYFTWQIDRERWHLIEGVKSEPTAAR
jgi:hypothetical protein